MKVNNNNNFFVQIVETKTKNRAQKFNNPDKNIEYEMGLNMSALRIQKYTW